MDVGARVEATRLQAGCQLDARIVGTRTAGAGAPRPRRARARAPWNLDNDEYIARAFDQLRQDSVTQPEVAAAILRVLRMLRTQVEGAGHRERVPTLERRMRLLVDALRRQPGLHPEDLQRLEAMTDDRTDPADHSR